MGGTRPARDLYTVAVAPPGPGTFLYPLPLHQKLLRHSFRGGVRVYLPGWRPGPMVAPRWARPDTIHAVLPGGGRPNLSAVSPFSFLFLPSIIHTDYKRPSVLGLLRPPDLADAPGLASRSL